MVDPGRTGAHARRLRSSTAGWPSNRRARCGSTTSPAAARSCSTELRTRLRLVRPGRQARRVPVGCRPGREAARPRRHRGPARARPGRDRRRLHRRGGSVEPDAPRSASGCWRRTSASTPVRRGCRWCCRASTRTATLNVPADAWDSVENARRRAGGQRRPGAGCRTSSTWPAGASAAPPRGPRLSLAALVADPGRRRFRAWLGALATDERPVATLTSTLAAPDRRQRRRPRRRLQRTGHAGGSVAGRAGRLRAALPALAVWMTPHGPVRAAVAGRPGAHRWRPGMPGLPPDGLAQALFDEARAGADVAALAARPRRARPPACRRSPGAGSAPTAWSRRRPRRSPGSPRSCRPDLDWSGLASVWTSTQIIGGGAAARGGERSRSVRSPTCPGPRPPDGCST